MPRPPSSSSSSSSSEDEDDGPEIECLDISNDEYYLPKNKDEFKQHDKLADDNTLLQLNQIPRYGSRTIQHSLPAYDLWHRLFPTYLSEEKFKNFHRPKLRHYHVGPQARLRRGRRTFFPIKSLSRKLFRYQKQLRNRVIRAINEGRSRDYIVNKFLLIREAGDLSAKVGELMLFEYCEEHPPVLSQIGMASNVKTISVSRQPLVKTASANLNKTKKLAANQNASTQSTEANSMCLNNSLPQSTRLSTNSTNLGFVEEIKPTTRVSTYFNPLHYGDRMQVIENNLYRAPIFEHEPPSTDFLVIRTRNSFYIRSIRQIFTVGQTMPLEVVAKPNKIQKFRLDLSNLHIHRLFKESLTGKSEAILNFTELAKRFPDYAESTLKKRLRQKGAIPGPPGRPQLYKAGKSNYGSCSLLEMRKIITPDQFCLNMSTLAAMQTLRELNYTDSMIVHQNDADLEVEVKAAPWNTTKAVQEARAKRTYLDLKAHLIDPTGSRAEGFSCVPWDPSPTETLQREQLASQRLISSQQTSTPLKQPVQLKNPLAYKIAREKNERLAIFQRESRMIAQVQAKVLSSNEVLSSDDEDEDCVGKEVEEIPDDSFDQQLCDLDRMVEGNRTLDQLNHEKEEAARRQLLEELNITGLARPTNDGTPQFGSQEKQPISVKSFEKKKLKIIRTYETDEGPIERTEIVRDPRIIALYVKQKSSGLEPSQLQDLTNLSTGNFRSDDISHELPYSPISLSDDSASAQSNKTRLAERRPLVRTEGLRIFISQKVFDSSRKRRHERRSNSAELCSD